VPDPIKAMEIMSQLNMEGGKEPPAKARSMANDKNLNPEVAEKFRQDLEKAKAEVKRMSDETRAKAEAERPRTYTERLQDMGRLPKSGGGGGGISKLNRDITKSYRRGGNVSTASKRADGCCIKGKTRGRMV
jgi:hypothetical protein